MNLKVRIQEAKQKCAEMETGVSNLESHFPLIRQQFFRKISKIGQEEQEEQANTSQTAIKRTTTQRNAMKGRSIAPERHKNSSLPPNQQGIGSSILAYTYKEAEIVETAKRIIAEKTVKDVTGVEILPSNEQVIEEMMKPENIYDSISVRERDVAFSFVHSLIDSTTLLGTLEQEEDETEKEEIAHKQEEKAKKSYFKVPLLALLEFLTIVVYLYFSLEDKYSNTMLEEAAMIQKITQIFEERDCFTSFRAIDSYIPLNKWLYTCYIDLFSLN